VKIEASLTREHSCAGPISNPLAGVGICDGVGRFVEVSESLAVMLKRTVDGLVGRPFATFLERADRASGLVGYFEAVVVQCPASMASAPRVLRWVTGDGKKLRLHAEWVAIRNGARENAEAILLLSHDDGAVRQPHGEHDGARLDEAEIDRTRL